MKIGDKIRLFRLLNLMSQEELAVIVDTAQRNIAQIEGGRYKPSGELIYKLANELNLSPLYLSNDILPPFKYKLFFSCVPPCQPKTTRLLNELASEIKEKWGQFLQENAVKAVSIYNDDVFMFRIQQTLFFIYSPMLVIQGSFIQAMSGKSINIEHYKIDPKIAVIMEKESSVFCWDETIVSQFLFTALKDEGLNIQEIVSLLQDQNIQIKNESIDSPKKIALTKISDLMNKNAISLIDIKAFRESLEQLA